MANRLPLSLLILTLCASLAAAQATASRVRVSSAFEMAMQVKNVDPQYPAEAKRQHIEGVVVLKIHVDKEGNVETAELMSGHPLLVQAAIDAVKQWKYKPYLMNGSPWPVETTVPVNFTLADKPAEGVAGDAPGVAGQVPGGVPGAKPLSGGVIGVVITGKPGDATSAPLPRRVRVSSGVAQGLLQTKVYPDYPADAKDQRVQGVVVLKVNIDKDGNVYKAELISGHPLLAPAAIDAVKQWKYKPYLLNSSPIEVETQVQVNFTLQ